MKNYNGLTSSGITRNNPLFTSNPFVLHTGVKSATAPAEASGTSKSADDLFEGISNTLEKAFTFAIYVGARLILGAILWLIISYIFPQLREAMPNFYKAVDLIVGAFDSLVGWVLRLFGI